MTKLLNRLARWWLTRKAPAASDHEAWRVRYGYVRADWVPSIMTGGGRADG